MASENISDFGADMIHVSMQQKEAMKSGIATKRTKYFKGERERDEG